MRKQILLLLLLVLLFTLLLSCSPQRRFDRLIKRHPDLIQLDSTVQVDSSISVDTAVIDRSLDTAIDYLQPLPLVLTRDRVRLDIKVDSAEKKIYISCQCQDRFITITKKKTRQLNITKKIPVPTKARKDSRPWWLLWWVLGFTSAVLLHSLLRKFLSPK